MKKKKSELTERRIHYFTCKLCGKRRQTFKRSKKDAAVCTKCERNKVDENQMSMF